MSGARDNGGGLSLQTLVIASLSSLAAALFIHEFWQAGAVLGAAVTPVIVAIVSEALRKPAQVMTKRTAVNPPPVVTEREDRFGIWEDQRKRRRRHLRLGLAIATGLAAFAAAAFVLTGAELVLGGASDSDRFRVVPGKQRDRQSREAPARTQPGEATPAPAPEEDEPAPETTPPEERPPGDTFPPEPDQGVPPPPDEEPPPAEPAPEPIP